jgi:adenosylcobinamide-phosphate synthase
MHMQSCDVSADEGEYEEQSLELTVIPDAGHVRRAVALVWRVMLLWLVVGILMAGAHLAGFVSS